jgi:uncharacterized protein (DUF342 family)
MPSPREKAMKAFQRLRRLQCADARGMVTCISCGRVNHYSKMDGGHYENRKNRATELEPDNVHGQCKYCNGPLAGNSIAYRNRLLVRIGPERLSRIEDMAMAAKGSEEALERLSEEDRYIVLNKRKNKEYEQLAQEYKALADKLEKEIANYDTH